jgi:hypothetical protein
VGAGLSCSFLTFRMVTAGFGFKVRGVQDKDRVRNGVVAPEITVRRRQFSILVVGGMVILCKMVSEWEMWPLSHI